MKFTTHDLTIDFGGSAWMEPHHNPRDWILVDWHVVQDPRPFPSSNLIVVCRWARVRRPWWRRWIK